MGQLLGYQVHGSGPRRWWLGLLIGRSWLILPGAGSPPSPPSAGVLLVRGPALLLIARLLGLTDGRERGGERGTVLGYMPGLMALPAHRRFWAWIRVFLALLDRVPTVHTLAFMDALHVFTLGDAVHRHGVDGGDCRRHRHHALPP